MHPMVPLLAAALLRAAVPPDGELAVQVHAATVDIRARGVPLRNVLDVLSRKTGMKVVYEIEPPPQKVHIDLTDVPIRSAVTELLRGHGLTYAFTMNPSGQKPGRLVLTDGTPGSSRLPASARPAGDGPRDPPYVEPQYAEPQYYEETTIEPPRDLPAPTATPAPAR